MSGLVQWAYAFLTLVACAAIGFAGFRQRPRRTLTISTKHPNIEPQSAGSLARIPTELIWSILWFVGDSQNLSRFASTCRYLHAQTTPLLYRNILFDDKIPPFKTNRLESFLSTISMYPELSSYVISFTLYIDVNFPSRALPVLDNILSRLNNLKMFHFDYTYIPGDDVEWLPTSFRSVNPPFSLERFSWKGVIPDLPILAAFIATQTSLRHLGFHSLEDRLPLPAGITTLPNLRILETTPEAATHIIPHHNVTHFKAYPVFIDRFSLSHLVDDLRSIRVLSAYGTYQATISLASFMHSLERLQINAQGSIKDFPPLLSRLSSTKIYFLRLTWRFRNEHETTPFVKECFRNLASLRFIECRVSSNGVFRRWIRKRSKDEEKVVVVGIASSEVKAKGGGEVGEKGEKEEQEQDPESFLLRWPDARAWVDTWETGYEDVPALPVPTHNDGSDS